MQASELYDAAPVNIGDAIKQARGSRGQEWLADQLGVKQPTVSDWENGRRTPMPQRFADIERVLGIEPGTLARIHYGDSIVSPTGERPEDLEAEQQLSTLRDLTRGMSREDIQRVIELLRITREQ